MGKESEVFLKVDEAMIRNLGSDAAVLYAFLLNASKVWKKDDDGYFVIWTKHIREKIGWSKWKIIRHRDKLVEVGLLRIKSGVNQNQQTKYKLT
jgi:hypothetical protein